MATLQMKIPELGEDTTLGSDTRRKWRSYMYQLNEQLRYVLSHLSDENFSGGISAATVNGLREAIAQGAQAEIGRAKIGYAQVQHLEAQVAQIVTAAIQTAVIEWAQIHNVEIGLADIKTLDAETATIGTAFVGEMVGGRLHLRNLTVDEANIVSLTVGQLLLRDAAGKLCKLTAETDPETGDLVIVMQASPVDGAEDIVAGSITASRMDVTSLATNEAFIASLLTDEGRFLKSLTASKAFLQQIAPQVGDSLQIYSKLRDAQDAADEAKTLADKYARVMEISDGVHIKTTDAEDHAELHLDAGQIVMRDTQGQAAMTVGTDATRVRTLHAEQAVRLGGLTLRRLESGAVVLGQA